MFIYIHELIKKLHETNLQWLEIFPDIPFLVIVGWCLSVLNSSNHLTYVCVNCQRTIGLYFSLNWAIQYWQHACNSVPSLEVKPNIQILAWSHKWESKTNIKQKLGHCILLYYNYMLGLDFVCKKKLRNKSFFMSPFSIILLDKNNNKNYMSQKYTNKNRYMFINHLMPLFFVIQREKNEEGSGELSIFLGFAWNHF